MDSERFYAATIVNPVSTQQSEKIKIKGKACELLKKASKLLGKRQENAVTKSARSNIKSIKIPANIVSRQGNIQIQKSKIIKRKTKLQLQPRQGIHNTQKEIRKIRIKADPNKQFLKSFAFNNSSETLELNRTDELKKTELTQEARTSRPRPTNDLFKFRFHNKKDENSHIEQISDLFNSFNN